MHVLNNCYELAEWYRKAASLLWVNDKWKWQEYLRIVPCHVSHQTFPCYQFHDICYFSDSAGEYPDTWLSFTSYVPKQSSTRVPVTCSYATDSCYNPTHANPCACSCWNWGLSAYKNIWGWPTSHAHIRLEQTKCLQTEGKFWQIKLGAIYDCVFVCQMCICWCHEWIAKVKLSDFTQKFISVLITWIQFSLLSNLFMRIKYMYSSCHICPNKYVPYVHMCSALLYIVARDISEYSEPYYSIL